MTIKQRVLAALAKSTSRTPMSTAQVFEVVRRWPATLTALEELRAERKVGHCLITKKLESVEYWWLAGKVTSDVLPQTAAQNRKTIAAKARKAKK